MSEWNKENIKRIKITRNKGVKTHLFVDDRLVVAERENLQSSRQFSIGEHVLS